MRIATDAIDAIVLAGGMHQGTEPDGVAPGYKALTPFGNRLSIQYVLDALRQTPGIRRIAVIGPEEALRPALAEQH
ncbi:MAG TPA: NTP transferase domain-containing protein, partial [Armatimonadota bacterium]|nr:NTP transferase domain-containing protein [Armatimonadota bacterium]